MMRTGVFEDDVMCCSNLCISLQLSSLYAALCSHTRYACILLCEYRLEFPVKPNLLYERTTGTHSA